MNIKKDYLKLLLKDFVFEVLDEKFYKDKHISNLMRNVPVPLKLQWIKNLKTTTIDFKDIIRNMILVVGADPDFKYAEHYKLFMFGLYKDSLVNNVLADGKEFFEKKEFDKAFVNFNYLLSLEKDNGEFHYYYGMASREIYLQGGEEDLVGTFKAEALKSFEKATLLSPELPQPYYFLGYSYLNLGMYLKASITWKTFVELIEDGQQKEEIKLRLEELKEPVEIEQGCNYIISGNFETGRETLLKYSQSSKYENWWPMYFYLGIASLELAKYEESIEFLKKVLRLDSSNIETMELLVKNYALLGDLENQKKYLDKIELILDGK